MVIENSAYAIDLSDAEAAEGSGGFGHGYTFFLGGAAAKEAGDPGEEEYLVHFPSLLEIAKAEGLELVLFTGLHKFYADVLHGKSLSDLSGAPVAVCSPLLLPSVFSDSPTFAAVQS